MSRPTFESTSTVAVRGAAQLEVDPDYAQLYLAISVSKGNRDAAMAKASRIVEAVRTGVESLDGVRSVRFPRVRVHRDHYWDEKRKEYVAGNWMAGVRGSVEIDVDAVPAVVSAAVARGAEVFGVYWYLDGDNPAYREVRKLAVDDAHRAAQDFADALGAQLGALMNLADPGLLAPTPREDLHESYAHARPSATTSAMDDYRAPVEIDLDPEPQYVYARVEGSYRLAA